MVTLVLTPSRFVGKSEKFEALRIKVNQQLAVEGYEITENRMFRNPEAHQPKIFWDIDEQDALEILGLISYCHRRLDKAQKIRIV